MPTKKTSKEKRGGAARGKKAKAAKDTVTYDAPTPFASASLDVTSHPYILSLIIDHTPLPTLSILAQCSKYTCQAVIPKLYRKLRLTTKQFDKLIEVGNAPSKRGSMSGLLGRSFSPYLRVGLEHVHHLHIVDFSPQWVMPKIPRGAMANVITVVLGYEPHYVWRRRFTYSLPVEALSRISKHIRDVTIITRNTYGLYPVLTRHMDVYKFVKDGVRSVTFVCQPVGYETPEGWRRTEYLGPKWNYAFPKSANNPSQYAVRLIGGNYPGLDTPLAPQTVNSELALSLHADAAAEGTTMLSFTAWLDVEDNEAIFGSKEVARFRKIDAGV